MHTARPQTKSDTIAAGEPKRVRFGCGDRERVRGPADPIEGPQIKAHPHKLSYPAVRIWRMANVVTAGNTVERRGQSEW